MTDYLFIVLFRFTCSLCVGVNENSFFVSAEIIGIINRRSQNIYIAIIVAYTKYYKYYSLMKTWKIAFSYLKEWSIYGDFWKGKMGKLVLIYWRNRIEMSHSPATSNDFVCVRITWIKGIGGSWWHEIGSGIRNKVIGNHMTSKRTSAGIKFKIKPKSTSNK